MVIAAASMVLAALAVVIALLVDPGSDQSESAALQQARDEAAAARAESDAAAAMANAATVIAEEAAAKAALAEEALVEALIEARAAADPEAIARLEAQLAEVRNLAATALVATEASAADGAAEGEAAADGAAEGEAAAGGAATDDDPAVVEDATEPEEEPAEEEAPTSEDAVPDEPAPEPDGTATGASADLPGEPSEVGPSAGTGLAVVGIRHNGALNMRAVPNGEIIGRLDNVMDDARAPAIYVRRPDSDDIITTVVWKRGVIATGNTRQLTTSTWHEFLAGDLTGWSSATYLAQLGATEDATSQVVDALGEIPVADTMVELGLAVAQTMVSDEPQSSVVVSGAPGLSGDLGQVTIDIVGIGDDSVRGFRLVIFAHPAENWTEDDPGPFTLKSVERTVLCHSHRGVSEEGLCN